jgi:cold shock CspA family protein
VILNYDLERGYGLVGQDAAGNGKRDIFFHRRALTFSKFPEAGLPVAFVEIDQSGNPRSMSGR